MIKPIYKRMTTLLVLMIMLCQTTYIHALDVKSSSAILMDAGTGEVLYEKNSQVQRPMASTSKIMTYLLTMEAVDAGKITLEDTVKVSQNATKAGGSSYKLKANDRLSVSELLNSMMMISANDSAVVLAEHVSGTMGAFVSQMNLKAKSLGLTTAYFVNPNGMPLKNQDQNKISAKDLALLTKYTLSKYESHLINITSQKEFYGTYKSYTKRNTNQLLRNTSFTDGLKTGYTDKARHCLVSTTKVKAQDQPRIISVILGGSSSKQRYTDSQNMLEYGLKNYDQVAVSATVAEPAIKPADIGSLVPLSQIARELGTHLTWNSATKTITGRSNHTNFSLTIGNEEAIINGDIVYLPASSVIIKGTTMVPMAFIEETYGTEITWDNKTQAITISSKEDLQANAS